MVVLVGFQHSRARGEGGPLVCCLVRGCDRPRNFLKNRRFSDSGPVLGVSGGGPVENFWGCSVGGAVTSGAKGAPQAPSPPTDLENEYRARRNRLNRLPTSITISKTSMISI